MRLPTAALSRLWPLRMLLLAAGTLSGLAGLGANRLELLFLDARFALVSATVPDGARSDSIAVILIDARSGAALGAEPGTVQWRRYYPQVIRTLRAAGASLVVFDSVFQDAVPEWDGELARSLREAGNVVAGEYLPGTTNPALRGSFLAIGGLGAVTLRDGVPRYVEVPAGASDLHPLAVVAAEALGGREVPGSRMWINCDRMPGWFPTFSFADVFRAADGRLGDADATPLSVFSGKTVLIGLDARDSDPLMRTDLYALPNTFGVKVPGVYGHALALHTIQDGPRTAPAPFWLDGILLLAFSAVFGLILGLGGRAAKTALTVLWPVAVAVAWTALFASRGLWLAFAPLFVSTWTMLALHWISRRLVLAANLRRAIGFDPALIEAFRKESARTHGQVGKDVAVLVADVRGFTSLVARGDPGVVTEVMGAYMAAMENAVSSFGGYVNKYVGDEIVAVFGFPLDGAAKEARAVRAGFAMLASLETLRENWKRAGKTGVDRIGIGIDTGPVTFSEVGGKRKIQFDIIGNCINGAARLQAHTKECGCDFVISEEAFAAIRGESDLAARFRPFGKAVIRGQGERSLYGLS